jgi:hypothetical protein
MGSTIGHPNFCVKHFLKQNLLDWCAVPNYHVRMNWSAIIHDLRSRRETYKSIAEACGFASKSHVHDLAHGRQTKVLWELGDALLKMHKRVMRRKA